MSEFLAWLKSGQQLQSPEVAGPMASLLSCLFAVGYAQATQSLLLQSRIGIDIQEYSVVNDYSAGT